MSALDDIHIQAQVLDLLDELKNSSFGDAFITRPEHW